MATSDVLPECAQGFQDVRLAVAIIERDIMQNAKVVDKLSEAVEKIQEMNQNLCKMIALHELRHENAEKILESFDEDIRKVHGRIDTVIGQVEPKQTNSDKRQDDEVKKALAQFNKWKYMGTGALLVIGYLLSHLDGLATFLIGLLR